MNEIKELKKQNKQLKKLLENAVELLNRYKAVLDQRTEVKAPKAKSKARSKRTPAKKASLK